MASQAGWSQLAINFNDHLDNMNIQRASANLVDDYGHRRTEKSETKWEKKRRCKGIHCKNENLKLLA